MKNTRPLNGLHGLGVSWAILLVAVLAVVARSPVEATLSSTHSVVRPTPRPRLLLRQPNPPTNSAYSQPTHQLQVSGAYNSLSLYFEANRGQTDPQVKFVSRGRGYTLFLTRHGEAVLILRKPAPKRDPLQPPALVSAGITPPSATARPPAAVPLKPACRKARPPRYALRALPR